MDILIITKLVIPHAVLHAATTLVLRRIMMITPNQKWSGGYANNAMKLGTDQTNQFTKITIFKEN